MRDGNEDAYLVDDAMGLVAVADGMGGHRAGEVASATALEALRAAVTSGRPLRESIEDANEAVFTKSLTDTELARHGHHAHRGDARERRHAARRPRRRLPRVPPARRRAPPGHRSTTAWSRSWCATGKLTADEAAVHPQRSIITRALGVDSSVDVDVYPVELVPGDRLLLCSDGLTGMVQPDDIAGRRCAARTTRARGGALVDAANRAGGEDNITVVVVAVTDEAPLRVAPEPVEPLVADRGRRARPHRSPASGAGAATRGVGRVLLWALPIVLVLGIAVGRGRLVRAQGLLRGHATRGRSPCSRACPAASSGWDPTIEQRTTVAIADLRPAAQAQVPRPADVLVAGRRRRVRRPAEAQTTTTTTTTTTHDHDGSADHHDPRRPPATLAPATP